MSSFVSGDTAPDLTGTCTTTDTSGVTTAVNLTGSTLALHLRKPDGTTVTKTGALDVAASGTWKYVWQPGDLDQDGRWLVEVQCTFGSGKVETFGPTPFYVNAQLA